MAHTARTPLSPSTLGLSSHVLAGLLPFVSSGAIMRLGLTRATAALYTAGAVLLVAGLIHPSVRRLMAVQTASLAGPATRGLFAGGLAGFLVAGVAYYVGLADTPRVAEYVFLTRLDWLVQAAVAIVWLREPWTSAGLTGAALALAGGLVLAWSGAFGIGGLLAALLYILASLVGYSAFKPLSAAGGPRAALALTAWRHWVNTMGFVALAFVRPAPSAPFDTTGLLLASTAGAAIVVLFALRLTALTGLPLWVLSAQAPVQALVAIAVTLATTGAMAMSAVAGIALIVVGEVMVSTRRGDRP